jgi:hypothetical protein
VSKRRFEQIERIHPGMVRMSGTLWVLCRARRSGTCKLSGSVILPGDRVYRPLTNALRAVPGKAMSVQLVKLQRAQCVVCGEMYAQSVCFLMPCIGRRKRQGNDDEA